MTEAVPPPHGAFLRATIDKHHGAVWPDLLGNARLTHRARKPRGMRAVMQAEPAMRAMAEPVDAGCRRCGRRKRRRGKREQRDRGGDEIAGPGHDLAPLI